MPGTTLSARLSSDGLKLYVDGVEVASRADVTTAEHLSLGYWRIGGDTVSGWPLRSVRAAYFNGSIDEVAVYKHVLTPTEVAAHYAAGSGAAAPNIKPVAAFTADPDGLTVAVDGSTSTDADGTVDVVRLELRRRRHGHRCHRLACLRSRRAPTRSR